MSALSDAKPYEAPTRPHAAGPIPDAPSGAAHATNGVSVDYTQDSDKQWFVLRVSYGRALKAYTELRKFYPEDDIFCPVHKVLKQEIKDGKRRNIRRREAWLPGIVFVRDTPAAVDRLVRNNRTLPYLSYYYNHFTEIADGINPPLVVPLADMQNFIRLMNIRSDHTRIVTRGQCRFKGGDKVRITDGQFAGITGRVARVSGQQRVVVEIEGLCLAATAYIPDAFMEAVQES